MTQNAIVDKLLGEGRVRVKVERLSACGKSCASCTGGCADKNVITVDADNLIGAKPGQRVVIESSTKGVLGAALLVYILPIFFFLAAYILAALGGAGDAGCILISAGGFLLGAAAVVIFNRFVRQDRELRYTVIGLCSDT